MKTSLLAYASPDGSLTLRPAKGSSAQRAHDRNAAGLNHLAFNAENSTDVDSLYELLKQIGAHILDPPAEYPYFPGYYAVYFTDPDGHAWEVAHNPGFTLEADGALTLPDFGAETD